MELDINTLIPVGTFLIGAAWMLLVVLVEHLTTSKES
jgi:hypothetical protein